LNAVTVVQQRLAHAPLDQIRQLQVLAGTVEPRQQRKLVAADASQQDIRRQGLDQALGDGLQQPVSDRVATQIVDLLEFIEVEQQTGERIAFLSRTPQALHEGTPVGQSRQRLMVGQQDCIALRARCFRPPPHGEDQQADGGKHARKDERVEFKIWMIGNVAKEAGARIRALDQHPRDQTCRGQNNNVPCGALVGFGGNQVAGSVEERFGFAVKHMAGHPQVVELLVCSGNP
jgi:hypothetical protein